MVGRSKIYKCNFYGRKDCVFKSSTVLERKLCYLVLECLWHGVVDVRVDGRVDVAHGVTHHHAMGQELVDRWLVAAGDVVKVQVAETVS